MKLCFSEDVPRMGIAHTFGSSRISPIVGLVVFGGLTAWWTIAFPMQEDARWQHWLPTGLGALMCFIALISFKNAMSAENWLVKVGQDGIYIKFRSYLNRHFLNDGPIVVHLSNRDIESIQPASQMVTLPDTDSRSSTGRIRFFDITLTHEDTRELKAALARERAAEAPRTGILNSRTKYHDYPLRVAAPGRLRLMWKASPGIRKVETLLRRSFRTERPVSIPQLSWESLSQPEQEDLILELAELGELFKAYRLAELRFGYTRSEAKDFVDGLMGRGD